MHRTIKKVRGDLVDQAQQIKWCPKCSTPMIEIDGKYHCLTCDKKYEESVNDMKEKEGFEPEQKEQTGRQKPKMRRRG